MDGHPNPSIDTGPVAPSARREELLERAYHQVCEHGLADMSLRPLAASIGSSPRVLLFLFGSKDGLIRALLERARADEYALLQTIRRDGQPTLAEAGLALWQWLCAPERRGVLTLWTESYGRSLIDSGGAWSGFATSTVEDWLAVLAATQPAARRRTTSSVTERTLVLAILRGALLDLLATGDTPRTTRAVEHALKCLNAGR